MKHKRRNKAISWLLSFALVLSLLPGMSPRARADLTAGYYLIPASGSETLDLSEKSVGDSVKVYDNGGPNENYSASADGSLTITAPAGKVLTIDGTVNMESGYDYLIIGEQSFSGNTTIKVSASNPVTIRLKSDSGSQYDGANLTITVRDSIPVSFHAGDGSGEMEPATAVEGYAFMLPACGFTAPEGKVFSGWKHENDDTVYHVGSTVEISAGTVFTAQWENGYMIPKGGNKAVDLSGKSVGDSVKIFDDGGPSANYSDKAAGSLTITAPVGKLLTIDGTVNLDWSNDYLDIGKRSFTASNNTVNVVTSSPVTIRLMSDDKGNASGADLTVTIKDGIPVTFHAGDGSGEMESVTAVEGYALTLPVCGFTAPEGKVFSGWKRENDDTVYHAGDTVNISAETAFTAQWMNGYLIPASGETSVDLSAMSESYSFVIYDDGGLSGNCSPDANGALIISNAPEGKALHLRGSLRMSIYDQLVIGDATFSGDTNIETVVPVPATIRLVNESYGSHYSGANLSVSFVDPIAVTFDANGGGGTMANAAVSNGVPFMLPVCGFTAPEGKSFNGWTRENDENVYFAGNSVNISEATTFTAQWIDGYEIPLKGEKIVDMSELEVGDSVKIIDPVSSADVYFCSENGQLILLPPAGKVLNLQGQLAKVDTYGYKYLEPKCKWHNLKELQAGSSINGKTGFLPLTLILNLTKNNQMRYLDLTATVADPDFTVSFDANGGTGTMADRGAVAVSDEVLANSWSQSNFVVPECTFTPPEGKIFSHWLLGEEKYYPGGDDMLTITGNCTFVAQYVDAAYATFDPGYPGTEAITLPAALGSTITLLPESTFAAPAGKTFAGWKGDEEVIHSAGESLKLDSNVNYTAQWGDSVQVGTDKSVDNNLPVSFSSKYSLSQQIYTADELGTAGEITSVAFHAVSKVDTRNINLYVKHTQKSSFESGSDWVTMTDEDKVFSGQISFVRGEWTFIKFQTPFLYNGTDNLLLCIDDEEVAHTSYGNGFLVSSVPCMAIIHKTNDVDSRSDPKGVCQEGVLSRNRNDVRFFKNEIKHEHNFTYTADGATVTATCANSDSMCSLTDHKVTLTITAPTLTTYGQAGKGISAAATLTGLADFNSATGKTIVETEIEYAGRDGTTYSESTTAPENAGKYTAKITVENVTVQVNYEIAKATWGSTAESSGDDEAAKISGMANYTYGQSEPLPTPGIPAALSGTAGAQTTFYYSTSATAETGTVWENMTATTLKPGPYYLWAVTTSTNYTDTATPRKSCVFVVGKGTQAAPTIGSIIENVVTIGSYDATKTYEYAVATTSGEPTEYTVAKPDAGGKFTLYGLIGGQTYYLNLRVKATANGLYDASDAVRQSFIAANIVSVVYDANGGSGTVPAAQTGADIHAASGSGLSLTGYTFQGWSTDKSAAEASIQPGEAVSQSCTLYAVWKGNAYTVRFNANGGTGTMEDESFTYGEAKALTANSFTRDGYTFVGWATTAGGTMRYANEQSVKNLATSGSVTLYAVWAQSTYTVKVNVQQTTDATGTKANANSATVALKRGETVVQQETNGVAGVYTFTAIPAGAYSLVVTNAYETKTRTVTETVTVEAPDEGDTVTLNNVILPFAEVSAEVKVTGTDTPAVMVSGLNSEAETRAEDNKNVVMTMAIEEQDESSLTGTPEKQAETQTAIDAIKDSGAASGKTLSFLNIDVTKTTYTSGSTTGGNSVPITETNNVIRINIPYDFAGKTNVRPFRYHDGIVTPMVQGSENDGGYKLDEANGLITLYTKQFSTYAIGYTEATAPDTPTYSTGGTTATYAVTVNAAQNGTVSASHKSAASGTKVTITAKPNEGYEVDTVAVTDANGKAVSVTRVNDTTYTFTQPNSKVKIDVTFKEASTTDALAKFSDINASDWYADAVRWALDNGVMNGVSPKYFNPNGDTTRAMVVTMLWRMEGSPAYAGASEFTDVDADTWYTEAVRWASTEGIVNGYENPDDAGMIFNPNGAVTREQLATMLYRYAQYKKADVSANASLSSYGDAASVSSWAASAMQWAVGSGIINGIDSNLVPAGNATRAQVATMLMRYSTAK